MAQATYQRDRNTQSRRSRNRQRARQKNASLREQGLIKADVGRGAAKKVAEESFHYDQDDLAAFGLYSPYSGKWVLTVMAAARWDSSWDGVCEYKAVTSDDPEDGIEVATSGSKADLLNKIGADTSEKIEAGKYVVRPGQDSWLSAQRLDSDEYHNAGRNWSVTR